MNVWRKKNRLDTIFPAEHGRRVYLFDPDPLRVEWPEPNRRACPELCRRTKNRQSIRCWPN